MGEIFVDCVTYSGSQTILVALPPAYSGIESYKY